MAEPRRNRTPDPLPLEPVHSRAICNEIGERLRQEIAAGFRYNDQPLQVTASLGIAIAQPDDDVTSILRRADTAAYVAKHAGKARTELFQA